VHDAAGPTEQDPELDRAPEQRLSPGGASENQVGGKF